MHHDLHHHHATSPAAARVQLETQLHHVGHLLPAQAPLRDFVHHNTLHAYQHLPFHQAVQTACAQLETQGYLSEARFRELFQQGRILDRDLSLALSRRPTNIPADALAPWGITPDALARLAITHDLSLPSLAEREWLLGEQLVDAALVLACETPARSLTNASSTLDQTPRTRTWRDALLEITGEDAAQLVHGLLIRHAAAYLDGGLARWEMPDRAQGFWASWSAMMRQPGAVLPTWLDGLSTDLRQPWAAHPLDAALHYLRAAGVAPEHQEDYILRALLQLPGWAGMFNRMEQNPADRLNGAPVTLADLLATRLCLDHHAARHIARDTLGYAEELRDLGAWLRAQPQLLTLISATDPDRDTWQLVALARAANLGAANVRGRSTAERHALLDALDAFSPLARRQVAQEAYEQRYRASLTRALHDRRAAGLIYAAAPKLQAIFCIDDREEAIRRHFEALDPGHETFGAAGFFGVAIHFKELGAARGDNLCPVVVTPSHELRELPAADSHDDHARRQGRLALVRDAHRAVHVGSRDLVLGSLLTPVLGALSVVPMIGRVFFPRLHADLSARANAAVAGPRIPTLLTLTRADDAEREGSRFVGFTLDEQADRVMTLLDNIGLRARFGEIVTIVAHGSSSVNNPHMAAYDCGACSGRHGGPNSRALALMGNNPAVRERLATRGLHIPDTTWFIGAEHDTCTDAMTYFDVELLPTDRRAAFDALEAAMNTARAQSAHERCRKFYSAPRDPSPQAALRHVEARSADLSQARPELGHMTNAACVVGRRDLTRGLFMDRRAFLVSYDPTIDPDAKILERTLLAAGPVGAGINLEYYFSAVDNERFGAGTKLPHNLTGLIGVMDGPQSDLRTGLPRQMIEQHEPMRLLLVVETMPATIAAILDRQPGLMELAANGWLLCVVVEPDSGALHEFVPGHGFIPIDHTPEAATARAPDSASWYRGEREFLPFALLDR